MANLGQSKPWVNRIMSYRFPLIQFGLCLGLGINPGHLGYQVSQATCVNPGLKFVFALSLQFTGQTYHATGLNKG